ncbi:MAG: LPS export ABC transporter periplasmic protein LptC [Candidatus Omnitrophota bacterium]
MERKFLKIFFILTAICFIGGCKGAINTEEVSENSEIQDALGENTDQKILTFSLSGFSEMGKRSWDLKGDSADILTNNVVLLENVLGHSYTKENTITLTADKGEFDQNKSNLLLRDNVVGIADDGAKVLTDVLNWDATKREIDTDAFVRIIRENMEATGDGAFGQPDLKQMQLKKNVTVELKPATVITCDGALEVDTLNNSAFFNDNVIVIDERGKIWADKIEVYFDPKAKTIKKVFAKGNVKILRGENMTYSEEAIYEADSKIMTLTGRPRLVLYSKEELNAFTGN